MKPSLVHGYIGIYTVSFLSMLVSPSHTSLQYCVECSHQENSREMISEIIYSLVALLVENCTGVIVVKKLDNQDHLNENTSLIQVGVEEKLKEFTKFDPKDTIFCEYDPPSDEETDPKAWRRGRPKIKTSIFKSLKIVFIIQSCCATLVGLFATLLAFIDLNTSNVCINSERIDFYKVPNPMRSIQMVGHSLEGFVLELYDFFLLCTVFSWAELKQLNLPLINILVAFTDLIYELVFAVFGVWNTMWQKYPLWVMYTVLTIMNAVILARHFRPPPHSWKTVIRLSFTYSAQFVLGMSLVAFFCEIFWPWYNAQPEVNKVIVATVCPIIAFFPKVVCRLAAQKLKDVHPGSAHVFVSVIYGTLAIVYRVMQAELSSFTSFVVLGIAHGVVDLLERLTVLMMDYICLYVYKVLRCKRKPKSVYCSPRSRRFVADMSIQMLLQEGTGLVAGLGFIHLYHFMYSNVKPPYTDLQVVQDFFLRVFTGLAIDLAFNTVSVVLQTRLMNIAIMKVWWRRWKHHCIVTSIIALETMFFFGVYLFDIVRNKYNYEDHPLVRFAWNCSMPFSEL